MLQSTELQRVGNNRVTELNCFSTCELKTVQCNKAESIDTVKLKKKIIQFFSSAFRVFGASLVAQMVKNPPAMQETWVRSLGREDLLKKGMATHSSILAWRIP